MPWHQIAYRAGVVADLTKVDKKTAQRLLDKSKWLASNIENLRHDSLAPDLPGLSKYAVGNWRIVYSIDRGEKVVHVHLIAHWKEVYQ